MAAVQGSIPCIPTKIVGFILTNTKMKEMQDWAREEKRIRKLPPEEQKKERIKQAKEKVDKLKKERAAHMRRCKVEKKLLKEAKKRFDAKYKDRWAAVRNEDSKWFDYWLEPSGNIRVVWIKDKIVPIIEYELLNTNSKNFVCWISEDYISPTKKYD